MIRVYVDLPTPEGWYKTIEVFKGPDAKEEALAWVKETWGADDEGRVNLLTITDDGLRKEVTNE